MKLLVQPGDGIGPLVKAIEKAKKSIQIVIFRFDRLEVEKALEDAVKRGVAVHALMGAFMYHRIAEGQPKKGWSEHVVDTLWPAFAA